MMALCLSTGLQAHNPDLSSTVLVEQKDNSWILQIRAALTAFEYEVEASFGKEAYATPEEFRALVLDHVTDRTSIVINENADVQLSNGKVNLGHETSVTFQLDGTPEAIQSLNLTNSSFSDIPRNQSILVILKEGFAKDKHILDPKNGHTAELTVEGAKFINAAPQEEESSGFPLLLLGSSLLVFFMGYLAYKNRNHFAPMPVPQEAEIA